MSKHNQIDPRNHWMPRFVPWLIAALMLAVYGLTLNHWVTLANLIPVAKVSGFLWQPDFYSPLLFLITYPFRWLSPAKIPLALNIFSAVCSAATLGILARTIMLLPHDRTEAERVRERNDFAFLTIKGAWFPPLLAAALLGLEFTYWVNATSFTGEAPNTLLFAIIIWQLLEYRLDERPGRLYFIAVLYGAGLTENWALMGFLPVFAVAILWLRGWDFFNVRFLVRMALAGLAGMLFYLVLPLMVKMSGNFSNITFWQMLKPALKVNWLVIKAITDGGIRHNLLIMSVATFLPLVVMAIRWSASFGDNSRIGTSLVTYLFHGVNAAIFTVCVWVMYDSPFSPGQLSNGASALTMYYLSALGVGYYCGYYLLVFGRQAVPTRRNPKPLAALPKNINFLSPVIYWGTYVVAVLAVGTLVYKNYKFIRSFNDRTLLHYAELMEQNLPRAGGVLLSDNEGQLARTLLMEAALVRDGRAKDFLVVDTHSLNWSAYHRFLHKKAPTIWPELSDKKSEGVAPIAILNLLQQIAKSNSVCYLNPSFGYYFEAFYQEPHGLSYRLKPLPEDTLVPPPATTNLIAENRDFWNQFTQAEMPRLQQSPKPRDPSAYPNNPIEWVLMHLHDQTAYNPNILLVENFYSRALDFWGVELQRAGQLSAAAECFTNAQTINPDNITANINFYFNQNLQTGTATTIDPQRATPDQFGKYRNWNAVMNANGPFDEPSFIVANSIQLAQGGLLRQSIAPFARARELAPDNLPVRLWLAQLYLFNHLPDRALDNLHDPMTHPYRFGLTESNSTQVNFLAAAAHFQKNDLGPGISLLEQETVRHPNDASFLASVAQVYFSHALYTNALKVIEIQLAQTPEDPQWLLSKGYAQLQIGAYDQAISAMTRVLEITTNNSTARFNRAIAYLQSDKLNEAHADYVALQTDYTNSYPIAYGLAEIAWRQHATNDAIKNYQIYLANAPTNTTEFKTVQERVAQLRGK
jgi:tetratricopeptide (TPR) repeat protein